MNVCAVPNNARPACILKLTWDAVRTNMPHTKTDADFTCSFTTVSQLHPCVDMHMVYFTSCTNTYLKIDLSVLLKCLVTWISAGMLSNIVEQNITHCAALQQTVSSALHAHN